VKALTSTRILLAGAHGLEIWTAKEAALLAKLASVPGRLVVDGPLN
jgi:hypothetical protein